MQNQRTASTQNQHNGSCANKHRSSKTGGKKPRTRVMLQGWPRSAPRLPQAACFPPDPGTIQSGILLYLGGPQRSGEGGVSGSFWSSAESKAGCVKPNLVMLQPPAPPAPRPPSARHVTARERQENAEGLRWKSQRQVPHQGHDLKTTVAWWRSRSSKRQYVSVSRPVLVVEKLRYDYWFDSHESVTQRPTH